MKIQKIRERQYETGLFEFCINCKLAKAGKPLVFAEKVILTPECEKALESIQEWTWDLTLAETQAIYDKQHTKL